MKRIIEGVEFVHCKKYAICIIDELSDELKNLLREQLSSICHGISAAESDLSIYSYKKTLKSFLKRYNNKPSATQKGMIGELLAHIIINNFFNYKISSPFFNKEESSIKKGFDIILYSKDENSLWLTEVKSGELLKKKNSNQTTFALLAKAEKDLLQRINQCENDTLWLNALNDAKIVFEKYEDLNEAVKSILDRYSNNDNTPTKSGNINAFLVSVLFASLEDKIDKEKLEKKSKATCAKKNFNDTFILSLQKQTYDKVYQFLKEEADIEYEPNPQGSKEQQISV